MDNAAWFFLSSNQSDRATVADDIGIPGKQCDAFDTRLSNEHAVERILVNQRQSGDFENVFRPNLKFVIAIRGPRIGQRFYLRTYASLRQR